MNTDRQRTLEITQAGAQYDTQAKRLIGRRSILGHLIVHTIEAYQGMDPMEAAEFIDGEVLIGCVPVNPGETNIETATDRGDRIIGINAEDSEINEGTVRYDILFYVRTPDGLAQFIVNVEAQKDRPTKYHVLNRGLYYACRMVSSQKEREFTGQNYDNIKSVYSFWICMNESENSLHDYHLTDTQILGTAQWPGNLDMLHVIMLGLTNTPPDAEEGLILHRLLSTLLSDELVASQKIDILDREYTFSDTDEINEEVDAMCNLSAGIIERAEERGEERGHLAATTEFVTNMFKDHRTADEIANTLKLSLDNVNAILNQQGLLQS